MLSLDQLAYFIQVNTFSPLPFYARVPRITKMLPSLIPLRMKVKLVLSSPESSRSWTSSFTRNSSSLKSTSSTEYLVLCSQSRCRLPMNLKQSIDEILALKPTSRTSSRKMFLATSKLLKLFQLKKFIRLRELTWLTEYSSCGRPDSVPRFLRGLSDLSRPQHSTSTSLPERGRWCRCLTEQSGSCLTRSSSRSILRNSPIFLSKKRKEVRVMSPAAAIMIQLQTMAAQSVQLMKPLPNEQMIKIMGPSRISIDFRNGKHLPPLHSSSPCALEPDTQRDSPAGSATPVRTPHILKLLQRVEVQLAGQDGQNKSNEIEPRTRRKRLKKSEWLIVAQKKKMSERYAIENTRRKIEVAEEKAKEDKEERAVFRKPAVLNREEGQGNSLPLLSKRFNHSGWNYPITGWDR